MNRLFRFVVELFYRQRYQCGVCRRSFTSSFTRNPSILGGERVHLSEKDGTHIVLATMVNKKLVYACRPRCLDILMDDNYERRVQLEEIATQGR